MTEIDNWNTHALISLRSIFGGILITLFALIGLLGLGLAFGGIGLDADTTAKSAGIFSGVWFVASVFVSIFVGSYFAARVSKFRTGRIGSAQGLIIAAFIVGMIIFQAFAAIGIIGSAAGSMLGQAGGAVASGMQRASSNPTIMHQVHTYAEDAFADLNLRSDPMTVAEGVGTRLFQGNVEGAKNYLARQAGISPEEADVRIADLQTKVNKAVEEAKEATATALRSTGWTLFLMVLLGALAAISGGALGSVANFRKPLIRDVDVTNRQQRYA